MHVLHIVVKLLHSYSYILPYTASQCEHISCNYPGESVRISARQRKNSAKWRCETKNALVVTKTELSALYENQFGSRRKTFFGKMSLLIMQSARRCGTVYGLYGFVSFNVGISRLDGFVLDVLVLLFPFVAFCAHIFRFPVFEDDWGPEYSTKCYYIVSRSLYL